MLIWSSVPFLTIPYQFDAFLMPLTHGRWFNEAFGALKML
jgi:hypothetical protein